MKVRGIPIRIHGRKQRATAGQALTEFAVTAPILFALLFMILILAWLGYAYVSITNAARMGARHMISYPTQPEDTAAFGTDIDAEITHIITSSMPMLSGDRTTILISPPVADRRPGIPVSVQVTYAVPLPSVRIPYVIREGSFVLIPPLALDAVSQMWLE